MAVIRKPTPTPALWMSRRSLPKGGASHRRHWSPTPRKRSCCMCRAAMLARVDQALQAQPIKIPRKTWILQAIQEKLARDMGADKILS